jgi:photosystem II stability/assembly factor-like uncharacterized protein
MKPVNLTKFAVVGLALVLLGAGCGGSSTPAKGPDGGVWKTTDGGQIWANKRNLVVGTKVTTGGAQFNILDMVMDPQDNKAIYLATAEQGIVYTLDGGDLWQQAKIPNVAKVTAIAIDPKNKCTVYVASGNKIYKTETCARDWQQIFFEPRTEVVFTRIMVDHFNPTILFAGTSDGDILRSVTTGVSWEKIQRIDGVKIVSIAIDARDSRLVYVGTAGSGIYKTVDGGTTWTQIRKQFGEEYTEGRRVTQVVLDPVEANVVYNVCRYGILKSIDGGETWTALNLTSPPGTVKIASLAIDPKNNKNLVYTGVSTLQFSTDGGVSWTPKKLPTTQAGSVVMFDPIDSKVLYLGTTPPPVKEQGMF